MTMEEKKKNIILIVDDEQMNIVALTGILSPDYDVSAVKDGQDAIEFAEEHLPDVILLDVLMPHMDGYTAINALKSSKKTRDIPVIFVTGLSSHVDEERGLALGAADYISKPFNPAIVKLRVHNQIKMINQTRLIIEKETAERSSRTKSEFLSRMSHEMRTPMNAVMGMTALMKNTVENEKQSEMLGKISAASDSLMKLIDDVLDISDIEDGKLRLSVSEFNFTEMIQETLSRVERDIEAKQQALTTSVDPSIPDVIIGDGRRLEQIIYNLISNAVKFTPEQGAVKLDVFAFGVEDETLTLKIEVSDNGIGITEEQRGRIFLPFEQAYGGLDRKFGGAGLSLTISKYLIELMGGEISVESKPGKGSKFIVTVQTKLRAPEIEKSGPVSLAGKTALLVEDVEINREIVIAMLEDTGLEFECAENGREALSLFTSDPGKYDVILMDINMPEMDGLEAARRIRALGTPEGEQVPIIAMTANVLMSEVETYLAAGMDGHVGKPVDFDKLLSMLDKYLG